MFKKVLLATAVPVAVLGSVAFSGTAFAASDPPAVAAGHQIGFTATGGSKTFTDLTGSLADGQRVAFNLTAAVTAFGKSADGASVPTLPDLQQLPDLTSATDTGTGDALVFPGLTQANLYTAGAGADKGDEYVFLYAYDVKGSTFELTTAAPGASQTAAARDVVTVPAYVPTGNAALGATGGQVALGTEKATATVAQFYVSGGHVSQVSPTAEDVQWEFGPGVTHVLTFTYGPGMSTGIWTAADQADLAAERLNPTAGNISKVIADAVAAGAHIGYTGLTPSIGDGTGGTGVWSGLTADSAYTLVYVPAGPEYGTGTEVSAKAGPDVIADPAAQVVEMQFTTEG